MVGALLLYMAFLMLVDPLIRKPDAYTEQLHNEEENEVSRFLGAGTSAHRGSWAPSLRVPRAEPEEHAGGLGGDPCALPPIPQFALPLFSVLHITQAPEFSSVGNHPLDFQVKQEVA